MTAILMQNQAGRIDGVKTKDDNSGCQKDELGIHFVREVLRLDDTSTIQTITQTQQHAECQEVGDQHVDFIDLRNPGSITEANIAHILSGDHSLNEYFR